MRFSLFETCLIGLFVSVVTILAVTSLHPPADPLAWLPANKFAHPDDVSVARDLQNRYGPSLHSQGPEEWIIRDVFYDERGGTFADIGAWHAEQWSNTYYLERELGWSGLAVDASPAYAEEWRRTRPRSRFVTAFVDARDGEPRTLYVADEASSASSTVAEYVSLFKPPTRKIEGTSATLDTLLTGAGLTSLDFLSLDIELGEANALAGFSIDRYRPRLVCVEALPPVRQALLTYFQRHQYVLLGKYLPIDRINLYFAPIERMPTSSAGAGGRK